MLKVGIIGCGAIGSELALAVQSRLQGRVQLVGLCDLVSAQVESVNHRLAQQVRVLSQTELIAASQLVVESASVGAAASIAREALSAGRHVMILSSGGLIEDWDELVQLAERQSVRMYIPSGALMGLDALKGIALDGPRSISLTTRKPLHSLQGAPGIEAAGIVLDQVSSETTVFDGSPQEALKLFPQNINVSATLRLALLNAPEVRVRILTSPEYDVNSHEVMVESDFVRVRSLAESLPSDGNLKTSRLAVLSAIATLEQMVNPVRIGT